MRKIKPGFQRINPTPLMPRGVHASQLANLPWGSQSAPAELFKQKLKPKFRKTQKGRCCFCRRMLYHDYATHFEHFLDKDSFNEYAFEIRNLSLCCGTCNTKKNGYFSTWQTRYNRFTRNFVGPRYRRCPALKARLKEGDAYPENISDFRWVHPHVHDYSDHIEIRCGWVYHGITRNGRRTIRGAGLNLVEAVEARAISERFMARDTPIALLFGSLGELQNHEVKAVYKEAIGVILQGRVWALMDKTVRIFSGKEVIAEKPKLLEHKKELDA